MNDEDKTPRPEPGPEEDGTAETEEMRDRGREVGPSPPPRWTRTGADSSAAKDDRVIAGVAGGLGNYFDIDPIIIRIAFAVSVLFGGLGVVAYLAVAIFVPADDGTGAPIERESRSRDRRALGIVAIAVIVMAGLRRPRRRGGVRDRPRLRPAGRGGRRDHRDRPGGAVVPRRSTVADRPGARAVDRRRGGGSGRPRPRRAASASATTGRRASRRSPPTATSSGSGGWPSTCAASTGRRSR